MKHWRNLVKFAFQRVTLVSISLLLQILLLAYGVIAASTAYRVVSVLIGVLSWIVILYILSVSRAGQAYKLAWVIPILCLPVLGVLLYLLFGGKQVSRASKKRTHEDARILSGELRQDPEVLEALKAQAPEAEMSVRYLKEAALYPVWQDSPTRYYSPADAAEADLFAALESAERYIFLEYFIISPGLIWDRVLEILERKAAAGVQVRLLYDDFGCIKHLPMRYAKQLAEKGIRAYAVNPYIPVLSSRLNNRDHRKLLIVDGKTAFTGGVNLSDEYFNKVPTFGHWKDSMLRVQGRAAWAMCVEFLIHWRSVAKEECSFNRFRPDLSQSPAAKGFVQPYADTPLDEEQVGENVYLNVIRAARRTLDIQTPYLVIDEALTVALCAAARSGVRVRIFTPGIPDKWYVFALTRAYYGQLTEAGVQIYEYTPGFLHSKVFLADEKLAVVGTINLDFRSLYLHYEDAVLLAETDSVDQVAQDFQSLKKRCARFSEERIRSIKPPMRLLQAVLRVFAPLM